MMMALAWPPALPPVSISIGINAVSTTYLLNAFSNDVMMLPVKVAEIINSKSHGILFLYASKTVVFKYGLSDGITAAIFSISSVVSSSRMSTTSSTVMMPTSLSSLSTTGMAVNSYFLNIRATSS